MRVRNFIPLLVSGVLAACGGGARTGTMPSAAVTADKPSGDSPAIEFMSRAQLSGKRGAPVDVRYHVVGDVAAGVPMAVELVLVPRVAGSNLQYEVERTADVDVAVDGGMAAQKANATQAYRRTMSVVPKRADLEEMRVLVSIETADGLAFGVYRIPLKAPVASGKSRPKRIE
jgi:hypothetical protein